MLNYLQTLGKPSHHILVAAQMLGVLLCVYPVGLSNRGSVYSLILCLAGAVTGLYALWHNKIGNFSIYPQPKAAAELVTSGPYRVVRHPMYLSLFVMMLGIALYNFHWINVVGLLLVGIAVSLKAVIEERLLAARFEEYAAYKQRTSAVFPGLF